MRFRRDTASLEQWMKVPHDQTDAKDFTLDTPTGTIFSSNATCALVPETVIGPYYVAGELIRTDITDGQAGVPVHLDLQFVDVATCNGVSNLLVDIWHCNSTGVYSGVAAQGQGGLNTTHGRGVQSSSSDGVVEFDTLFPGHYTGRATHIHVMSTSGATTLPNGTFTGGTAKHIGHMYFDEDLRTAVEATVPYSSNRQTVTTNAQDSIAPDEATEEFDPFLNYVMLGDSLSDGLLMWMTIGIDTSADHSGSVSAAAHYYAGGGVAQNSGGGGGGAGGPGAGGPGSGRPSGTGVSVNSTVRPATLSGTSVTGSVSRSTSTTAVSTTISSAVSVAAAAGRPRWFG
jgi:protocatechuate 3,4-dioxygenase beta subunit